MGGDVVTNARLDRLRPWLGLAAGIVLALGLAGCGVPTAAVGATDGGASAAPDGDDSTPDVGPDGSAPAPDLDGRTLAVGVVARTTADLNLRTGAGTSNPILLVMPCGAAVTVVGGPAGNWWQIDDHGTSGWASGLYLVPASAFDASVCAKPDAGAGDAATSSDGGGGTPSGLDAASIIARAKLGVGFSYWWGHGAWRSDGMQHGSCTGSCPSCSHGGSYGADCSGFVAKCWQVPSTSALTQDLHPYSTWNFQNQTTHWSKIARSSVTMADAMVYNANGEGHIVLVESGDPWGQLWLYEARGCATGIVHDLRSVSSTYTALRREGL